MPSLNLYAFIFLQQLFPHQFPEPCLKHFKHALMSTKGDPNPFSVLPENIFEDYFFYMSGQIIPILDSFLHSYCIVSFMFFRILETGK